MRPAIERGKLKPPKSLSHGEWRLKQLPGEIARIEDQLTDPTRVEADNYVTWRQSALRALALFKKEQAELGEWLAARRAGVESLLKEAWQALRVLAEEVDFEPSEQALMKRLDEHFNKENENAPEQSGRAS